MIGFPCPAHPPRASLRTSPRTPGPPPRMIETIRTFNGIHLLLARSFAPLDERKEAAVARLMAIPEYLESVRPNLQQVPSVLLASSMDMAAHGPTFVDEVVRTLMRQFPGEAERLE